MKSEDDSWKERWERVSERPLGKGGQGLVYSGRERNTHKPCAIKEYRVASNIDPQVIASRRERARREVFVLETLRGTVAPLVYDHNITVANVDNPAVSLFVAMELIPGCTLDALIEPDGKEARLFSLLECLEFAKQLGPALVALHSHSFFHRDLKPDNVMLRDRERSKPVLIDFGLVGGVPFQTDATYDDEQLDNRFLSLPELKHGESPDVRSDTALFAGLLFYVLTGRRPVLLMDADGRQPHQRYPLPESQASRLDAFFSRAFQLRPYHRFGSIEELVTHFSRASAAEDIGSDNSFHALVREHLATPSLQSAVALAQFQQDLQRALEHIDREWHTAKYLAGMPDNSAASIRLVLGGAPDNVRNEEIWLMLVGAYHYPNGSTEAIAGFRIHRVEGGALELQFADDFARAQQDPGTFLPVDAPVGADATGAALLAALLTEKAKTHGNALIERAVKHGHKR